MICKSIQFQLDKYYFKMKKHQIQISKRSRYHLQAERGSPGRQQKSYSPLNQRKIEGLQHEFQGLKDKIKQVEEKNSFMLQRIRGKIHKTQTQSDSLEQVVNDFQLNLHPDIDQSEPNLFLYRTKSQQKKKSSFREQKEFDKSRQKSEISENHSETEFPTITSKFINPYSKLAMNKSFAERLLNEFEENICKDFKGIEKKVAKIQNRILSLDVDIEETKKLVHFHKRKMSQSKQIKQVRQRQHEFILNEAEVKIKKYVNEIDKLQKHLIEKDLEVEKLSETITELKDSERQFVEKNKKKERQMQQKLREQERRHSLQLVNIKKQQTSQQKQKNEVLLLTSKPFESSEEIIQELEQKIEKLKFQNQQYDKLIHKKTLDIEEVNSKLMESQIMSQNIKSMFEQLMQEHKKLQEKSSGKQLEYMQNVHKLNQMTKKKLKQHEEFKKKLLNTLQKFESNIPKKVKKEYHLRDEKNKITRSMACFFILEKIFLGVSFYRDQQIFLKQCLHKIFNITEVEYEISGVENILKEIGQKIKEKNIKISELQQEKSKYQNQIKNMSTAKKSRNLNVLDQNIFNHEKMAELHKQARKKEEKIQKLKKEVEKYQDNEEKVMIQYETKISELNNMYRFQMQKTNQLKQDLKKLQSQKKLKDKQNIYLEETIQNLRTGNEEKSRQNNEKSAETLKEIVQLKGKVKSLQVLNNQLINKRKKEHQYFEMNQSANSKKMNMKQKTIDDLLKQKNDLTIENRVLKERVEGMKQENKKKHEQNMLQTQSIIRIKQNNDQEVQTLKNEMEELEGKVIGLQLDKRTLQKRYEDLQKKFINNESKQKIIGDKKLQEIEEVRKQMYREKHKRQNIEQKHECQKNEWKKEKNNKSKELQKAISELKKIKRQNEEQKEKKEVLEKLLSQKEKKCVQLMKIIEKKEEKERDEENRNEVVMRIKKEKEELKEINKELIIKIKENEIIYEQKIQKLKEMMKQKKIIQQEKQKNEYLKIEEMYKKNLEKKEKQLERKEKEILDLIDKNNEIKEQMMEDLDSKSEYIRTLNNDHEGQIELLKEQVEAMQRAIDSKDEQIERQNQKISELESKLETKEKEILDLIGKNNEMKEQMMEDLDSKSEYIRTLNNDHEGQIQLLKEQVEAMQRAIDSKDEQIEETKRTLSSNKEEVERRGQKISELMSQLHPNSNNHLTFSETFSLYFSPSSLYSDSFFAPLPLQSLTTPSDFKLIYLQQLKHQLIQILQGATYFSPSFIQIHTQYQLQIAQSLKIYLLQKCNQNESFLSQLAFIDQHTFEFLQIDKSLLQIISDLPQPSDKFPAPEKISEENQVKFEKQIYSLSQQVSGLKKQIDRIVEEKQEELEQSQRQHINQSQIYKKQLFVEKKRADRCLSNLESLKKIIWKLLQIWFSDENMLDDLSDCFEHYQAICINLDEKEKKIIDDSLNQYHKKRLMMEAKQKKKKWF